MEGFLNFIIDKYVLFLTISIVLIFAIIGYFVDMKRKKNDPYRMEKKEDINLDSIQVDENISLNDSLNRNAGIVGTPIDVASSTVNMASQAAATTNNNQNQAQ